MLIRKFSIFIIFICTSCATNSEELSIVGEWQCKPYVLENDGFEALGVENLTIRKDGTYVELETASYHYFVPDIKFKIETVRTGSWTQSKNVVTFIKETSEIISSNNPTISVDKLQEFEDQMLLEEPPSRYQILSTGSSFRYKVLNTGPLISGSKVFECDRA